MTTYLAFALAFFALCSPALADSPPPRAASFKLKVTVHDGDDHRFHIVVGPRLPCASASRATGDHRVEIKACVAGDAHVQIEWRTRRGPVESSGTSAVPLESGTTTTLGSEDETRIDVAIQ